MAVAWTQLANWGPMVNPGSWQTHYWRIPFAGTPHIVAAAYISYVSIGEKDGVAGSAMAAFKRFEFLDDQGILRETEVTAASAFLEVEKCVSITVALDLEVALVCGGWAFHYLT